MPVIGITGGVASGKSSISGILRPIFPEAVWFSADVEAASLLAHDTEVRQSVVSLLGSQVFDSSGQLDRPLVRTLVFGHSELLKAFEAILHPRIRETWVGLVRQSVEKGKWMFAEIPLLYETAGHSLCDRVVVAACSPQTQRCRMMQYRGLSESLSEQIRVAQMSLSEKCSQSDHLIWNDCSFSCLVRQTRLLARWLRSRYT